MWRSDRYGPQVALRVGAGGASYRIDAGAVVGVLRRDGPESGRMPVCSLAERLGAADAGSAGGLILTLESRWGRFGLAVDSAEKPPGLGAVRSVRLPRGLPAWFTGVVPFAGEMLMCLSADALHPEASRGESLPDGFAEVVPVAPFTSREPARRPVLLFSLPGLDVTFVLSAAQIVELGAPGRVWSVPGAPAWFRGVTEWRARPLPVVDLAGCLQQPPTPASSVRRFLIARSARSAETVALPIGADISSRALPLPYGRWTREAPFSMEHVRGLFEGDGRPVVAPDLDAIMS